MSDSHRPIAPDETVIGSDSGESMDVWRSNSARIDWLIQSGALRRVAIDHAQWEALYVGDDGRHWLMTWPQSEMHGGGPRRLEVISPDEASKRFDLQRPSVARGVSGPGIH